jgi:DNA mismatch repair ATPase MutS
MGPREFYKDRIESLVLEIRQSGRILRRIALSRFLAFIAIFPAVFFLIPKSLLPGILLAVLFLVVFLALIKIHLKRNLRHRHLQELLKINRQESESLDYKFSGFNPGDEFIDTLHPFSYDMDLFGQGSIFQYLNRTITTEGKILLAGLLRKETLDQEIILERQQAVKELGAMPLLLQDFQAAGRINQEEGHEKELLEEWVRQPGYYLSRKFYIYLAVLLPVLTVVSFILSFFFTSLFGLTTVLYLLQLFIIGGRFTHTSLNHQAISKQLEILRKYQALLAIIERGNYSGNELKSIYSALVTGEHSASHSIRSLTKIVSAFDSRLNVVAAIFLEGLFLWDIQCMIRLERWKEHHGGNLTKWIKAIGRYDALSSLATYAFNHPAFSYPLVDNAMVLEAEAMGHILIPEEERVCNNFAITMQGNFILITGANMAGKSTFLRTVATNMILAMAGTPVCARKFSFQPMPLFSSMRTSDSLNKHESYFYAELRRLKELLERLGSGEKLFIILDEILKGTNSTDKQKGSRAALQQIIELGGTGIIATHDLELARIEKDYPDRVKNMCFEIEIDKAKISFDYLLKEGITTKMNALLLMEQMGIIRDQGRESSL